MQKKKGRKGKEKKSFFIVFGFLLGFMWSGSVAKAGNRRRFREKTVTIMCVLNEPNQELCPSSRFNFPSHRKAIKIFSIVLRTA
jgi:hypothetical protein